MDLAAFEARLEHALREGLAAFAVQHTDETFYAVAIYSVYRELDAVLGLPALAASSNELGPALEEPSSFWSARFTPADWPYNEIEVPDRDALEAELTTYATRGDESEWRETEGLYFAMLERIARRLQADARRLLRTSDDFICYWHDEEFGVALARSMIAPAVAQRVFGRET
ncbi:MAG TPA: DUF4303 domain-containing protein [Kofleriaceae bacterium]|jgi:hypothetical protein